jgi:hypothetical protein
MLPLGVEAILVLGVEGVLVALLRLEMRNEAMRRFLKKCEEP